MRITTLSIAALASISLLAACNKAQSPQDVQNNVTIALRRRARAASREPEAQPTPQTRK